MRPRRKSCTRSLYMDSAGLSLHKTSLNFFQMPISSPQILATVLLADADVEYFPLPYKIACIVLSGMFLWTFSIARDPRGWRRLYQAKFSKREGFSVNRNKTIDETIKKWGITIAMMFLIADVTSFIFGLTYQIRNRQHEQTPEEKAKMIDVQLHKGTAGDGSRRNF